MVQKKTTKKKPAAKKPAAKKATANSQKPWLKSYPKGIDWNAPIDTTPVFETVLKSCDKHGDRVAIDFLGATTSYASLGSQIRAMAGALQKDYGIKKGSRVAIMLPNTPFFPVAYYAVLLCGGTVVNCNPLYSSNELSHIIGNSGADLLITIDLTVVFEKAEKLMERGDVKKAIVGHFPDFLSGIKKILFPLLKGKEMSKWQSGKYASQIEGFASLIDKGLSAKPVKIDADKDVAVQQYTGGTTGAPKGAMLSHANIAANLSQIQLWGCGVFEPPAKVVAVLPFFHIFAMTVCMNVPLSRGASIILLPRFEMKMMLALLKRTRPDILPAVPTLTLALANAPEATREALSSLKLIISGGAALPDETRAAFAKKSDALLAEGYGLTETSPVVCCAALNEPSKPMSIGLPVPGTDIRFVDIEDSSKFMPLGERGELVVKGKQVMLGYFDNEQANKEAFTKGWFRTGDVGYMDEDGYSFLVDRIKDIIICSGFNVYPRAIEEAISKHEAVDEVTVIGVKDDYRGEAPIAFIKLLAGKTLKEDEMKEFLKEHLSKIEMPKSVFFKDELPKTLVGKLSKKELREEYAATHD